MLPGYDKKWVTGVGRGEAMDVEERCGFTSWPGLYGPKSSMIQIV